MEKKNIQAMAVAIFAAALFTFAMAEGSGNSELGEIQDAMRRLNWLNNLQYSYIYTYSAQEEIYAEQMEVWADLLTESWAADYYVTDEDGTLPILKQFSDGKKLYRYIDWAREWTGEAGKDEEGIPRLDELMRLEYTAEDIREVVRTEQEGKIIISYLLSQEYLEQAGNERGADMEKLYRNYENAATSQAERDSLQISQEQYRQMGSEEVRITYVIDENGMLQSGVCEVTLVQPEIAVEENAAANENEAAAPGEETQLQYKVQLVIKGYNQDTILDKIEWYREEI